MSLEHVQPGQPVRPSTINALIDRTQTIPSGPRQLQVPGGTAQRPTIREGGTVSQASSPSTFVKITTRAGTHPGPYRYTGTPQNMDIDGSWSDSGAPAINNIFNYDEQNGNGEWVAPLNVGDVLRIEAAPGGSGAYIGYRSGYRGVFPDAGA